MPRKNEMLDVLEKRQDALMLQIREAKQEIELYEEDDTTPEEEDLRILEEELVNINKQITNIENHQYGEAMDPHRFGED